MFFAASVQTTLRPAVQFSARKKADEKKPAATTKPASIPPKLVGDTEANREKAARFLCQVFPFEQTTQGQFLKDIQDELIEFFKDGADFELRNIQELIRLTQSTQAKDNNQALQTLVSVAREMGHSVSMDD